METIELLLSSYQKDNRRYVVTINNASKKRGEFVMRLEMMERRLIELAHTIADTQDSTQLALYNKQKCIMIDSYNELVEKLQTLITSTHKLMTRYELHKHDYIELLHSYNEMRRESS